MNTIFVHICHSNSGLAFKGKNNYIASEFSNKKILKTYFKNPIELCERGTKSGFHKSWVQSVKRRAHPKSGRKCKKLSTRC